MLEKAVTNAIIRYLKALPACFCWKEHGGIYGTSGLPDIICCYRGRFVAFEVKRPAGDNRPAGKLSRLQALAIEKIIAAKGNAFVVDSLEEVQRIIEDINSQQEVSVWTNAVT